MRSVAPTAAALVVLTVFVSSAHPVRRTATLDPANSGTVSQYTFDADGTLVPKSPEGVTAGRFPNGITISPDGASVYVANRSSDDVSQYDVAPDGTLTPNSPRSVAAGNGPVEVAVSPDGASTYVANAESDDVSQYDVAPDGTLTPKVPATVGAGALPLALTVSPDGSSLYVANWTSDDVSQYGVAPDGTLTPKVPATVGAGMFPTGISVRPDGGSAYVTNVGSGGGVSQYDVAPDGTLTPKTPATVGAGRIPRDIAVSPDGMSAYVTNEGVLGLQGKSGLAGWVASSVAQYDIGPAGTLMPKAPAMVEADGGPFGIAIRPGGEHAYVTELNGGVAQYDVGSDGTLAAKGPASLGANSPHGIVISPDGNSAYVVNAISGPTLQVDAKRKQRVSRLKVKVSCLEQPCEAVVGGRAVAKNAGRRRDAAAAKQATTIKLRRKSLAIEPGERVTVRLKYRKHRRSVKALRHLLKATGSRKRSKVKAMVKVTATDAAGNAAHRSIAVRLKR